VSPGKDTPRRHIDGRDPCPYNPASITRG